MIGQPQIWKGWQYFGVDELPGFVEAWWKFFPSCPRPIYQHCNILSLICLYGSHYSGKVITITRDASKTSILKHLCVSLVKRPYLACCDIDKDAFQSLDDNINGNLNHPCKRSKTQLIYKSQALVVTMSTLCYVIIPSGRFSIFLNKCYVWNNKCNFGNPPKAYLETGLQLSILKLICRNKKQVTTLCQGTELLKMPLSFL